MIGQVLTSSDPEPPLGSVVRDSAGGLLWVSLGDYWVSLSDYNGPETWTKISGNYGPAVVLHRAADA